MPDRTKIATCSYCGARSMLVPTARDGHELACASCGAPLHELKWLKAPSGSAAHHDRRKKPKRAPHPGYHGERPQPRKSAKRHKRRKPMWKKALEEAFDIVEDIFD